MMPENDWYGHKLALAWYCGYSRPPAILGTVPHGWGPELPPYERKLSHAPLFVWSERHRLQAKLRQTRNVRCVGAPFSYLVRLLWPQGDYPEGYGTLVFPSHSSESLQEKWDVDDLIAEVEAVCEPPYTVSIYYQDREHERNRAYEEAGWRSISFGSRSDPTFLLRLAVEVSRHSAVVGNVMQTALTYGAILGRRIQVVGPPVQWRDEDFVPWGLRTSREVWPRVHEVGLTPAESRAFGEYELGWANLLQPDDLRAELGWDSWTTALEARILGRAFDLRAGRRVRRGDVASRR